MSERGGRRGGSPTNRVSMSSSSTDGDMNPLHAHTTNDVHDEMDDDNFMEIELAQKMQNTLDVLALKAPKSLQLYMNHIALYKSECRQTVKGMEVSFFHETGNHIVLQFREYFRNNTSHHPFTTRARYHSTVLYLLRDLEIHMDHDTLKSMKTFISGLDHGAKIDREQHPDEAKSLAASSMDRLHILRNQMSLFGTSCAVCPIQCIHCFISLKRRFLFHTGFLGYAAVLGFFMMAAGANAMTRLITLLAIALDTLEFTCIRNPHNPTEIILRQIFFGIATTRKAFARNVLWCTVRNAFKIACHIGDSSYSLCFALLPKKLLGRYGWMR
jgi:hypothetical protein